MINELVFFGCSHSVMDWKLYLELEFKFTNYAEGGSSNELILKKLKKFLNDNWDNLENKILIIQFSYFHRKHIFFDLTGREYKLNGVNAIENNYGFSKEENEIVQKYYTDWLKYFYNGEYEFSNLLNELRLLKKLLDSKNVKYIWYLWDDVQPEEVIFNEKNTNKILIINNIFEELNFLKFDGECTVAEYSKKNKLRNCDLFDTTDNHIAESHKKEFVKNIKNKLHEFFL